MSWASGLIRKLFRNWKWTSINRMNLRRNKISKQLHNHSQKPPKPLQESDFERQDELIFHLNLIFC
jgi:hypothetical protein